MLREKRGIKTVCLILFIVLIAGGAIWGSVHIMKSDDRSKQVVNKKNDKKSTTGNKEVKIDDATRDRLMKSMSFFVGKVARTYTDGESKLEATDLTKYINIDEKSIKSITGELFWDYDRGILKIDTPKAQGATGFLNKEKSIELGNITIQSGNEYATVVVISLDDKPLETSGKILIQAMTEDKFYGAKTENNVIKDLGTAPLNVKNIDVKITFKGKSGVKSVIALDENGYKKSELEPIKEKDGLIIQLPPGGIYTALLDSDYENIENPYTSNAENASYVWWEAEDAKETNYPKKSYFDTTTEGKWNLLSGDNWLSSDETAADTQPLYAKYDIEVPKSGEYNFWVRKFWLHGPFKWRFDDKGEWSTCGSDAVLADNVDIRTYVCANWINLGKVNLDKGTQSFEFQLLAKKGEKTASGFDCFMLTRDVFVPRGELKPGDKTGFKEDGYWAFETSPDPFKNALMDLRYLNEEMAGQSGFVSRDGDKFKLGDGTEVKFWAVDATMYQDKKSVDYMAKRLAKYGVNMVRVHGALFDSNSADLSVIDKDKLDKLHYFVSAMKAQGIYSNISFYFPLWVNIKPEYGIPGYDTIQNKLPFSLLQFDSKFQDIYKKWAKTIFETKNPYTGLPLSKDPAVAIIEVQNEDNYLFWTFGRTNIPDVQMNKLETLYGSWLKNKYGSIENAVTAWGTGSAQSKDNIKEGRMELKDANFITRSGSGSGAMQKRMSDQLRFLVENQKKFYEDMVSFYRDEIGTKSMISASNWTTADPPSLDPLERYTYTAGDVIDRHAYFECNHQGDAASYSVRVGHTYSDVSVLTDPGASITPIVQVEDYPQMITETAWTNPNKYHGESVPMWSAYGALQGIDAVHFFAVGTADWETTTNKFPVMVPSIFGQFPGFSLMYRRGDIREADEVIKLTESFNDLYNFKGSPIYENQALDILRNIQKSK